MIDFRYHLISIVAVFLALGIGVLMGSAVLGENIVQSLRNDLDRVSETNRDLRDHTVELEQRLDADEDFARAAQPLLIGNMLRGEEVVLVTIEGSETEVLDRMRAAVEEAGGSFAGAVTARSKLALENDAERDELALLVGSVSSSADEVRAEAGSLLGERMAAAAAGTDEGGPEVAANPLEDVLGALEDAGYADVESVEDSTVPRGALFLMVGGSEEPAPFPLGDFWVELANGLASGDAAVVAAESAGGWGLVTSLRADTDAQGAVTTVEDADTAAGAVGVVLALREADDGAVGRHYGRTGGVDGILPSPTPPG